LVSLAKVAREKLGQNYRCLYLNSPPMVAGMLSYLAAVGVDVAREICKKSLVVSSEQQHLDDGRFDVERMMGNLKDALQQALEDGYAGLWASGDMTWEMGPDKDFSNLLEYEQRLEDFFQENEELSGVCQYHANTLPPEAVRQGLIAHSSIFVNETLYLINPHYIPSASFRDAAPSSSLDAMVLRLSCSDGLD